MYLLEPPRRGGSNEYPQYMFLSKNKKNNVYYIKMGFRSQNYIGMFSWWLAENQSSVSSLKEDGIIEFIIYMYI